MKRWAQPFIRRFIIDEHGAVSIYLIIVVICLFFFNAVLIDYARILVAERRTEIAAQAAARSTMASFNPALHRYGLFGLDDPHPTATFRNVFQKNLSAGSSNFFHFADPQMVKAKTEVIIRHDRMLSNTYTFQHQILEDMKYRAPIQFTSSIIDGFLKVSDAMEQASAFVDIASDIDKKARKRKKYLDSAKSDLLRAKSMLGKIERPLGKASTAKFPAVQTLGDIIKNEKTYKEIVSPDQKKNKQNAPKQKYTKSDAHQFERNARRLLAGVNISAKSVRTDLKHAISELDKAKTQNQLIKTTITKKRKQKQGDYATAKSYEKKYGKNTGAMAQTEKNLKAANKKLDDYVMTGSYFTISKGKMEVTLHKIDSKNHRSLFYQLSHLNHVVFKLGKTDKNRLLHLQKQVQSSRKGAFLSSTYALVYFEKHRKFYQNKDTSEKEKTANKEEKIDKKKLDHLINQAKNIAGDTQIYKTLQKLVDKYNGQPSGKPKNVNLNDPTNTSDDAMGLMDQLFRELGKAMKTERNKVYINEYILTRFKSHDFNIKDSKAYNFENNQVEYIIYGLNGHGANYAAALSELFVVRFAVNFVDAFTDPKVDSTGPFIFWAALADALAFTIENISILTHGHKIMFVRGLHYTTDYKDYLRLFLFLHPRGKQLQRVMAVIDHNSGTDLTNSATYITGTATSALSLWFIPEIEKMLSKTGLIAARVKERKILISKKAVFSY